MKKLRLSNHTEREGLPVAWHENFFGQRQVLIEKPANILSLGLHFFRKMHEQQSLKRHVFEHMGKVNRMDVRKLTNESLRQIGKRCTQIFRRSEVPAENHAFVTAMKRDAVRFASVQVIVRRWKRNSIQTAHLMLRTRHIRMKFEREGKLRGIKPQRPKPALEGLKTKLGKINLHGACAFQQVIGLDQEREATDMIRVKMREKNRIDPLWRRPERNQRTRTGLAGINEHRSSAVLQQGAGLAPKGMRITCTRAEKQNAVEHL
jgi:hypothetical protein